MKQMSKKQHSVRTPHPAAARSIETNRLRHVVGGGFSPDSGQLDPNGQPTPAPPSPPTNPG